MPDIPIDSVWGYLGAFFAILGVLIDEIQVID